MASVHKCGMILPIMKQHRFLLLATGLILSSLACSLGSLFGLPESQPVTISQAAEVTQPAPLSPATGTPAPLATPWPSRTPDTAADPLSSFTRIDPRSIPDNINPLTGLPVPNPSLLERRPIVAKIPNYPHTVRPQAGISLADQIYEYYLEWGLTRFLAIFYGNDVARFGPIRSGRIFDEKIVRMYNAIFVFNGADPRTFRYYKEVELSPVYFVLDNRCPPLCRDENIPYYNNLFGDTRAVHAYFTAHGGDDSRQELASYFFSSLSGQVGEAAEIIHVNYSYANYAYWAYHPPDGRYLRYQGSVDNLSGENAQYELHTDAFTGQPLAADNVVVLLVPHRFYLKSSDTEIFQIDLVGSGDAYIFRDGQGFHARWYRFAEDKPFALFDENGRLFPLKPGTTFFQVINDISEVNQKEEGTWEFNFVRPPTPDEYIYPENER